MDSVFLGIVVFLIVLAIFDLIVGVSNDAVNFLNSAIGAKVAKFRVILLVAAIGVFAGASTSNGMMDVARHGIMTPAFFSFYDVMCVFLAVMVTDIIILDTFNTLGMPTSTTVSMVFELLGGSFAIALIKIIRGTADADGKLLGLGDLLNTEKAMSVILGIFLSVAVAFVFGAVVQWITRLIFTFTYRVNGKTTDVSGSMGSRFSSSLKIGIFAGVAVTCIIWFLLINGLKDSSFMTDEAKHYINSHAGYIIGGGIAAFSLVMTVLSAFKAPVLKFVVLFGTFALAMAFAGNDLVNFIGVPLAGLESYQDYVANGEGDSTGYMMTKLMDSAHTPVWFLFAAGIIMVLSLVFSKKAQNVVKTSVDLSRQDEGDEMFGSSTIARTIVRCTSHVTSYITHWIPQSVTKWIDSRFNSESAILEEGAAFDYIRAAVNLVLAGLLVAIGTSLKLPLSTTYVTFMVAMATSLSDRAWSRESAVFRITGVLSVIGGWFITAAVSFFVCFILTTFMFFGSFLAMGISIILAVILLVHTNKQYSKKTEDKDDTIFKEILRSNDETLNWKLLREHVRSNDRRQLERVMDCYVMSTDAFFCEEYRKLKRVSGNIEEARKDFKRQRRREIIGLRRIDPIIAMEKNTWYFHMENSLEQMLYCVKRMNDPCREHVGNNFTPVANKYVDSFLSYRDEIMKIFNRMEQMLSEGNLNAVHAIREDAHGIQSSLSNYRKIVIDDIQNKSVNIESMTVFLNVIQESQELLANLRHMARGFSKFES